MNSLAGVNKVVFWADRVMVFSFYALIYFLPISIALVEWFSSIALVAYFVKRTSEHRALRHVSISLAEKVRTFFEAYKPVKNYLNLPIAVFLLLNFLSIFVSQAYFLSIKGFFYKLMQSVFIYFTFIECMNSTKRIRIFTTVFLVSATLVAVSGIIQLLTGHDIIFGHPLGGGRINSSFTHPNDLGAYLVVVCSLVAGRIYYYNSFKDHLGVTVKKGTRRFALQQGFFIALFILYVTCLGFTFSRGAWLAFFVSLIVLAFWRPRFLIISVLIILSFIGLFSSRIEKSREVTILRDTVLTEKQFEERLGTKRYGAEAFTQIRRSIGSGRLTYWREPLAIIQHFPVLGAGINTYSVVAPKYKISWGGYPHNSYLHMAAEIGIAGLLAFFWIVGRLILGTFRARKWIHDNFILALLSGAGAGLVGFLSHSFVDTNFYSFQLGNFMWIVFGLLMALQMLGRQAEYDPRKNP